MQFTVVILALAATVAAHGKVAAVVGDAGGNGTALGIKGAVVPGAGPNSKTEVDTTVFGSTKIATNGLGKTTGGGANKVANVASTMAQSGDTLPQVSASGGSISGTFHIVTTDGAGPVQAVVDPSGTGQFAQGTSAQVTTQVPGTKGNITPGKAASLAARFLHSVGLTKRAANVNQDFPFKVAIPAGTTCSGSMGGQSNVCLLKVANSNPAGPFGGVIAFQMAGAATGNTTAATAAKRFVA